MESDLTCSDMPDSEAESMIVHTNGEDGLEDLLSESELESDNETLNGSTKLMGIDADTTSLRLEPRAKTRLLSRSHSVNDLSDPDKLSPDAMEPPRRNSSGECPQQTFDISDMMPITARSLVQDIEPRPNMMTSLSRDLTPNFGISKNHLTPVNVQYSSPIAWKQPQTIRDKEDTFSILLQTTAERVLSKIKSRQQDLGGNVVRGEQKYNRRPSQTLLPAVPRKLQPITREGSKTPRIESDVQNLSRDREMSPLTAA